MKRIALMFALFFVVALVFPAEAPAPIECGDGVLTPPEECDPGPPQPGYPIPDLACPGECQPDCTCPDTPTILPYVETECPLVPTECPEDPTYCPYIPTECPEITTGCPVDLTYCPEIPTECPVCEEGEGCTPGFWGQPAVRWGIWPAPYTPDTMFCDVFECTFEGMTLLEVLGQGGGGLIALGRHTVAALLNATSSMVDYDLSAQDVIDMFNDVYLYGDAEDYEALKDMFEGYNEQDCLIGREDL